MIERGNTGRDLLLKLNDQFPSTLHNQNTDFTRKEAGLMAIPPMS
jgi:hypothetical protein